MNKENIAVIDADTIIYLASYVDGDINSKWDYCDKLIINILKSTNSVKYCGFLTEGKTFRNKIATIKEYKGNRKNNVQPIYYKLIKAYLYDIWYFTSLYNYEADDLCIMSHNSLKEIYNPIICSPDKDLKQISGYFFDYKKNESSYINEGLDQVNLWRQVLIGDPTDNISGCKGIGKIKANLILQEEISAQRVLKCFIETYGEYQGIINFTENYRLVKMLDRTLEGELYIPEVREYKREEEDGELW